MEKEFKTKSEYLDFIEEKFKECFSSKGYIEELPVNVTSKIDKTVDLVGSSISPLKKYVLAQDFNKYGRYIIQNSMKTKNIKYIKTTKFQKFGCYFKCMGILTYPDLDKVVFDVFDYFINKKYLGISPNDICIKICSEDKDLLEATKKIDGRIQREVDGSSIEHYRHKYGMDQDHVTGRDFNIAIRKEGTKDFITCASFVIMETPQKKLAIDMGIGNCTLSMCKFGVDSTIQGSRMSDFINIDSIEKEKFADILIAISTFLKEDIFNTNSKHLIGKFRRYKNALLYWNEKLNISNDEILNYITDYLNAEYHDDLFLEKESLCKTLGFKN